MNRADGVLVACATVAAVCWYMGMRADQQANDLAVNAAAQSLQSTAAGAGAVTAAQTTASVWRLASVGIGGFGVVYYAMH